MSVGKGHPFRGQPVGMRGRKATGLRRHALDVAIAQIIAQDIDDVGRTRGSR